ncbi:MAG TPA: transcription elongation factor subunit Spt4 [Candidatus Nanoarchaeia archaeon]|nr:transcription elongation factor subunit Spt4 [Candidatus Nanoarchaeia archaeon]
MTKKHACKRCKFLYDGEECPNCKGAQPVVNWKGRISILDNKNSDIAKRIGAETEGEYAIKVT